jgi:hypothetical protein
VKGFIDTPETTESFSLVFAQFTPRKFYASDFIKTQAFTDDELKPNSFVHMLIIDFFKDLRGQDLLTGLRVNDEGDYYESGKVEVLLQSFGATRELIDRIGRMLAGAGWKVEGGRSEHSPSSSPIAHSSPPKANPGDEEKGFYYCDNPRHPHGEVVQILTYERNPRCPYCGAIMTYGRYWSSEKGNPDEEEEYEEVKRRAKYVRAEKLI